MQESKPDKNRKSLRTVGWWWDESTLNEVRVENVIYQKEYNNHLTSSYVYLYTFHTDTQQRRGQERGGMNLRKKRKERKHPIFQQLASSALFAQSAFICMCLVKCLQALSLDEFDYISTSKWVPMMEPLSGFAKEATAPEWVSVSVTLTYSSKKYHYGSRLCSGPCLSKLHWKSS